MLPPPSEKESVSVYLRIKPKTPGVNVIALSTGVVYVGF
jgi:hypothetical protein